MIYILGKTGMLGSMVDRTWEGKHKATNRKEFDASNPNIELLAKADRVVNCIGVIKPYCDSVLNATIVNSVFPHVLPEGSIQIATDCVYSGSRGDYKETDLHDATDVYGKTKSLGEAEHIHNLRCSIIGPELKSHVSLLDWFLAQEKANGYINHWWNGITTLHFSKIVQGVIREGIELPQIQHIVPANIVNKAELLKIIAEAYGKKIPVEDIQAPEEINRTLGTNDTLMNLKLWRAAGYDAPPTIQEMIQELASL